jgi:hypothetical protein
MKALFDFPVAPFRALAVLAAGNDERQIRPYLMAVCCEVTERAVLMVATNGHALGAYLARPYAPGDRNLPGPLAAGQIGAPQYLIPAELADLLRKKGASPYATIEVHDNGETATLTHDGTSRTFPLIDGRFPDVRRVAARYSNGNGAPAQFDPKYIRAFNKAGAILAGEPESKAPMVIIGHNGPEMVAVVSIDGQDSFTGLLMPRRCDPDTIAHRSPVWLADHGAPAESPIDSPAEQIAA